MFELFFFSVGLPEKETWYLWVFGSCASVDVINVDIISCYTIPYVKLFFFSVGPPDKETWYLWVVGSCAVLMLLLLILLVAVPYVMWKHRVILVMKIVHYFQNYEENGTDREALIKL